MITAAIFISINNIVSIILLKSGNSKARAADTAGCMYYIDKIVQKIMNSCSNTLTSLTEFRIVIVPVYKQAFCSRLLAKGQDAMSRGSNFIWF